MKRTYASKNVSSPRPPVPATPCGEKVFSIDEVRRALPYVQRVVSDATDAFTQVQRIRRRLAQEPRGNGQSPLAAERDAAVAKLNRTIDECQALGISYVDIPNGRVGFRVEVEGRPACVLWRLGDPAPETFAQDAA